MTTRKNKIPAIARELKIAEAALLEWKSKEEPLAATMVMQYELLKKELLKDLLVELVQTGVSFNSAGDFIHRLTAYLQNMEQKQPLPNAIRSNLAEIETMLVA